MAASDGSHGAIIAWLDLREGHWDVYAQRINVAGFRDWGPDGVPVCTARGDQGTLGIAEDGAGGAIVLWHDYRCGSHVFAQRLGPSGEGLWTPDGVPVSTDGGCQLDPRCASDGAGGVIVAWNDCRGGVYAQRIDAAGVPRWNPAGVRVTGWVYDFAIAADGEGGAIVAYSQPGSFVSNIYAQRLASTGAALWASGTPVCIGANYSLRAAVVSDGAGGALVSWADNRAGGGVYHIFAQRVGADGAPQWATNGVALSIRQIGQDFPVMVSDGSHGAMVAWEHFSDQPGSGYDIHANHVDGDGAVAWAAGYPICAGIGDQRAARAATDGSGGAIIAWQDHRGAGWDVYAQRMARAGPRWALNGIGLCTQVNDQTAPVIVPDGLGGAIVPWSDTRPSAAGADVYAQRVDSNGGAPSTVGVDAPFLREFRLLPPVPNPAAGTTTFAFELPIEDDVSVDVFDVLGQRVRSLMASRRNPAGLHRVTWDSRNARGERVASGIYFVRVRTGTGVGRCKVVVSR